MSEPCGSAEGLRSAQTESAHSARGRMRVLHARVLSRIEARSRGREFAALSLEKNGVIRTCTAAAAHLFGYTQGEMTGRPISDVLPRLADQLCGRDGLLHPRLTFLCRCGFTFEAVSGRGERFAVALSLTQLGNPGVAPLLLVVEKAKCEAEISLSLDSRSDPSRAQGKRKRPSDARPASAPARVVFFPSSEGE